MFSVFVMADDNSGDNPGDVVVNPWESVFQTTEAQSTTEEVTTQEETTEPPATSARVKVTIDDKDYSVSRDGQLVLSNDTNYGFIMNGKYYKKGETVTVSEDTVISTVDQIDVDMSQNGAAICLDGRDGIKFKCNMVIKNKLGQDITKEALKCSGFSWGMLIVPNSNRVDDNLTAIKTKKLGGVNLLNSNVRDDDSFYCGIINVKPNNFKREYIARGYIKLTYGNGLSQYVYASRTSLPRSIVEVADTIAQNGYVGLNPNEKTIVDDYRTAE